MELKIPRIVRTFMDSSLLFGFFCLFIRLITSLYCRSNAVQNASHPCLLSFQKCHIYINPYILDSHSHPVLCRILNCVCESCILGYLVKVVFPLPSRYLCAMQFPAFNVRHKHTMLALTIRPSPPHSYQVCTVRMSYNKRPNRK